MPSLRSHVLFRQAPRDLLYVGLSAPIGLAWLIALVVMIAVGVSLSIVIVGIPLLVLSFEVIRLGARTERARAALVLGAPIARPPQARVAGGFIRREWARVTDRSGWKELGYMALLATLGTVLGVLVIALWSAVVAAIAAPALSAAAPRGSLLAGLAGWASIGIVVGGLALGVLSVILTRGAAL